MEKGKLSNLVTQHVKRWGFERSKYAADNAVAISIDAYADGPLGDKMLKKVRIYAGPEHQNAAQMPQPLTLK